MLQGHGAILGDGSARRADARAVYVDVNCAELLQNLVDGRGGRVLVRDVDGKGRSVVAELRGGLTGQVFIEVE